MLQRAAASGHCTTHCIGANERMALAGVTAALSVGVISPGPSFAMVAKEAVAVSRPNGLAAALYLAPKLLGGLCPCWLGWRIFRAAHVPLAADAVGATVQRNKTRSLLLGLGTQVANPKTAIVYASVFAAPCPSR